MNTQHSDESSDLYVEHKSKPDKVVHLRQWIGLHNFRVYNMAHVTYWDGKHKPPLWQHLGNPDP